MCILLFLITTFLCFLHRLFCKRPWKLKAGMKVCVSTLTLTLGTTGKVHGTPLDEGRPFAQTHDTPKRQTPAVPANDRSPTISFGHSATGIGFGGLVLLYTISMKRKVIMSPKMMDVKLWKNKQ
jgi:hypothetical protein